MKRRIYRSLDKPVVFFGIRGGYLTWMVMALVVDLFVSLTVGMLTVGMIGVVFFAAGAIGIYLFIINRQERLSDRQLSKRMSSRRLAGCIRRPPMTVRALLAREGGLRMTNT